MTKKQIDDNYDSEEEVNKGGRPSYEPNEKDEGALAALLSVGFPHRQIELYMRRSIKTLKKHYPDLFASIITMEDKNVMVENSLWYNAVHRLNVTAQIVWLKAHRKDVYGDKPIVEDPKQLVKEVLSELANKLPD